MASPCEILINSTSKQLATKITQLAHQEALRIEQKFSLFSRTNIIHQINHAEGHTTEIDDETHQLFEFADQCYKLSDGLFDVTSGVLKHLWNFKHMHHIPSENNINKALKNIGWNLVKLTENAITLPANMQIDLGGIGKEYAVDTTVNLLAGNYPDIEVLVNFGGDLRTSKESDEPWEIGIEGFKDKIIHLQQGAIATSGKTKQCFVHNNTRYSHLINPKTGWPIQDSPLSITVLAETTIQAGILATLAQLQGKEWRDFLDQHKVTYWSV